MKALQSNSKITEIEIRLSKDSYLSRSNLPGSADAKMFLLLQSIKKYPDRKIYPNFYHWYVLMKQFSLSSIEKWINHNEQLEDDLLLGQFTCIKESEKILPEVSSFKKINNANETTPEQTHKVAKSEQYAHVQTHEIQYVMDVKIKEGIQHNMKEFVSKFFHDQKIEVPDVQQLVEQRRVRIMAKIDSEHLEQLKNKISALEGVETFQIKKKDKRFKTVNSASNFLGQL